MRGSDANDYIIGGAGNDLLNSQAGADTYLISGFGTDVDYIADHASFDWGDPTDFDGFLFQVYGGDLDNPNCDIVEFDSGVAVDALSYPPDRQKLGAPAAIAAS